jgi:predicted CoA-substrate-specific enzyme activase
MITAGVDAGARTVKVVVMRDKQIVGKALVAAGFDTKAAANQALDEALKAADLGRGDVQKVLATGVGRKEVDFAQGEVAEVTADAKGIAFLMPSVRTVVDVGAEEGRAIKVDEAGQVVDFVINQKCAAGAGTFVEAMARALGTTVEEMSELYAQSTKEVTMNAHCAVFAESELVSLIHSQAAIPDIVRAVLTVTADKVVSMMRRVGIEAQVAAIGGVALNKGFIIEVEKELNIKIAVPVGPQFVGATGVAVAAAE